MNNKAILNKILFHNTETQKHSFIYKIQGNEITSIEYGLNLKMYIYRNAKGVLTVKLFNNKSRKIKNISHLVKSDNLDFDKCSIDDVFDCFINCIDPIKEMKELDGCFYTFDDLYYIAKEKNLLRFIKEMNSERDYKTKCIDDSLIISNEDDDGLGFRAVVNNKKISFFKDQVFYITIKKTERMPHIINKLDETIKKAVFNRW